MQMKTIFALAALLAPLAAEAQTYDVSVYSSGYTGGYGPGFGSFGSGYNFSGTFTFDNGVFSNVDINGSAGIATTGSGGLDGAGPLSSYEFGPYAFDLTGPLGTSGAEIESTYGPGGYCDECGGQLTVVSKATSVPEINPSAAVAGMTLLLGLVAVLQGRRRTA
jgi:hypothetical protein